MKKQIRSFLFWTTAAALAAAQACVLAASAGPDWKSLDAEALELAQAYLRIESVNPPANTAATATLLQAALARHGIAAQVYSSGPDGQTNLLARLPGRDHTKKPLLLLNHMDVVPVDRSAWPVDPFAAIVRDGFLWGRGSIDMKSQGVQHLMALVALKESGVVPARDIVMLSTADEETNGTRGAGWMIANHWSEMDPEFALDEGGFGFRDLLVPGRTAFGIAVGEKQLAWLHLRARGTAAHGSQPIPDNANMILLHAIERALDVPPPTKPNPVVDQMLRTLGGTLADNKFTAAIRRNTISLTTLRSGVGSPPKANVIPSTAEATLDCRLLPGVDMREFISDIKARINDPRVTVEPLATSEDAGTSRTDTPLFDVLRRTVLEHNPGAAVTPVLIPYSTDSVKFRQRGVTVYGFSPMVLTPDLVASMHGDAERVPVAEFTRAVHVLYDILRSDF